MLCLSDAFLDFALTVYSGYEGAASVLDLHFLPHPMQIKEADMYPRSISKSQNLS